MTSAFFFFASAAAAAFAAAFAAACCVLSPFPPFAGLAAGSDLAELDIGSSGADDALVFDAGLALTGAEAARAFSSELAFAGTSDGGLPLPVLACGCNFGR